MSRRPRVIRKFTAENFSFIFIVRIVRLQFVFCVAGNCTIRLTMNDNTWHYAVSDTEVLQPTQIEEMAVKTPENNWDLTLFTCTTTGQARYALRCVRTDE